MRGWMTVVLVIEDKENERPLEAEAAENVQEWDRKCYVRICKKQKRKQSTLHNLANMECIVLYHTTGNMYIHTVLPPT